MDKIIFEKIYEDNVLYELKIFAQGEYASVWQTCYIGKTDLEDISARIQKYLERYNEANNIEFGEKPGHNKPAFSMTIMPADAYGHIQIELDMGIYDNSTKAHRCQFYVYSELACMDRFANSLKSLVHADIGTSAVLND